MRFTDVVLHSYRRARVLAGLTAAAVALPGLLLTATASTAAASTSTSIAASTTAHTRASTPVRAVTAATGIAKPAPARPPASPGAATGAGIPAKPHGPRPSQSPGTWTVTLTTTPALLWPTEYTTLTATASQDIGPTPYYLRIYDLTAGAYIVTCATGTTCSAPVTQAAPTTHTYIAVVASAAAAYPPTSEQAISAPAAVDWQGTNLTLTADQATVPVGATATLTATTSQDIGPSPFWIEIYDATTGTALASCGWGTSCSATVTQATAATHQYTAYLSASSTAYPPPSIQETSALSFITWSNLGWQVSLSAPATGSSGETVTATANGNVLPTPYYIEIFNQNGTLLAECGSGSTCAATLTPTMTGTALIAFISTYSTAFPPPGIVASSSTITS